MYVCFARRHAGKDYRLKRAAMGSIKGIAEPPCIYVEGRRG